MKNTQPKRRKQAEQGRAPRRGTRLGQHFLTRPEIAAWVAESIAFSDADIVLEIGPGHGILTRELLKRAGKVVAVEKDQKLVAELQCTFANDIASGKLRILSQDIRDFDSSHCPLLTPHYTLVANIPYYITGLIIRKFLTAEHQPSSMALLVQKEVAERIVAKDGKESLLSLSVKAYGTPELVRTVRAGSFSPPPKVDSAVLAIRNISRDNFKKSGSEDRFFELIHAAFAKKRGQIGSTLKNQVSQNVLLCLGIAAKTRPEDVRMKSWLQISEMNR